MSKFIDLTRYREKLRQTMSGGLRPDDGIYFKAFPPLVNFRHYQSGVISKKWRLLSEYMWRELLNNFPEDSSIM
jgi:hypothetical protein